MAGCFPGDPDPDLELRNLATLLENGILTFLDLMEEGESNLDDEPIVPYVPLLKKLARSRSVKVKVLRFPIRDMSIPEVQMMRSILDAIDRELDAGRAVYVHCLGGVGRTGVVVGCWLARHGIALGQHTLDCLNVLRSYQPYYNLPSPQTLEQCDFVRAWTEGA